jgi:ankyrin repeat protein
MAAKVNDDSTASVQPSGGSVVDGPSASNITSPSSNGGARTTTSEDDAVSQPNGETQLSEQMQQLNIGQNATTQSNQPSLPELRAYCQSGSLTEHGLRERLSHLDLQVEDSTYVILLIDVCANYCVTHEIVQCVIEHVPGAVSAVDSIGATPLHYLCLNINVTLDIIRCVIGGNPDALLAQIEAGCTPLMILCHSRAVDETVAEEILTLFLETCPESAQCCTHDGNLPIHFACRLRSPEFCCMLIQKFPESIQHVVEGVPVVYYVLFSSDVNDSVALAVLKMLLEKYPDMLRDFRWNGQSVLHDAALKHLPRAVQVCRSIIRAFPELVLELDESTGRQLQPLHIACLYGNLPVVKCILELRPDAIRGESSGGNFPIRFAICASRKTPLAAVEVVKFLLTFAPSVVSQRVNGTSNDYPLIYACLETNASNLSAGLEVIKLLYNAYPEAIVNAEEIFRRVIDISNFFVDDVRDFINEQLRYATQASNLQLVRTQDGNGRLPLHHALEEHAPLGTIKLLVQANPSTIQTPDSEGSLPLHIAASEYECPNVIKYLLDNCRTSLLVAKDYWGNTPLHYACQEGRYDVIEMLLTQYPNAPVATRNVDGDLPIQLLLDCDEQESADYASCIFLLLKASPEMWMSNENLNLVLALTS